MSNKPKRDYEISVKEIKELLDYNKETGIFKWKWRYPSNRSNNFNAKFAGLEAGGRSSNSSEGYLRIKIKGSIKITGKELDTVL